MTDKIKKVNSLEDLERLSPGDRVNIVYEGIGGGSNPYVFEKKINREFRFIEFCDIIIHTNRVNKEDIKFENGIIKLNGNKVLYGGFYNIGTKGYKQRLKLCKKAGVI